jgi:hypothetical protein
MGSDVYCTLNDAWWDHDCSSRQQIACIKATEEPTHPLTARLYVTSTVFVTLRVLDCLHSSRFRCSSYNAARFCRDLEACNLLMATTALVHVRSCHLCGNKSYKTTKISLRSCSCTVFEICNCIATSLVTATNEPSELQGALWRDLQVMKRLFVCKESQSCHRYENLTLCLYIYRSKF